MTLAEKIRHLPVHREKKKSRDMMTEPFEEMMTRLFRRNWMSPMEWPMRAAFEGMEAMRADVIDRENEVVIRAEMPGIAKGDVDITLGDDTITLRGTHEGAGRKGRRLLLLPGEARRRICKDV